MMDKKKIEDFGTFCTLIANEPENVYCNETCDVMTSCEIADTLEDLKQQWNSPSNSYYHIPAKKRKIMALYYNALTASVFCLEVHDISKSSTDCKIPNSGFEVNE